MASLLYLTIWRVSPEPMAELCSDESQLTMAQKFSALPLLKTIVQNAVVKTQRGGRKKELDPTENYAAHSFHHPEGLCAVLGSVATYDAVAAQMVLNRVLDVFLADNPKSSWSPGMKNKLAVPKIEGVSPLKKYEDPSQINKLAAIQKDLDETMETMRHTIQQTTMRGEQLDNLVEKSDNLNSASKMFYQQARKQNSCCVLM